VTKAEKRYRVLSSSFEKVMAMFETETETETETEFVWIRKREVMVRKYGMQWVL